MVKQVVRFQDAITLDDDAVKLLKESMPMFNIDDASAIINEIGQLGGNDDAFVQDNAVNRSIDKLEGTDIDTGIVDTKGAAKAYTSRWTTSRIDGPHNDEQDNSDTTFGDISMQEIVGNYDDLPAFADEECRNLSREIKLLERERDQVARKTKEHKDRVSVMKEHLHNVHQEIDHTNGLLAAKNKEIVTEEHLIAVAEREKGVLTLEIKEYDRSTRDQKERMEALHNQIQKAKEELKKLQLSCDWNQEELEQWAAAVAKKDEDKLALERFTRADEVKIKELTLRLENLAQAKAEKKAELENETTEAQTKQLEVTRIMKTFKAEHEERRQLVEQWQKTVQTMKDRDNEINKIASKYEEANDILDVQRRKVSAKRDEIIGLKADVQHLSQEVDAADRTVQNKRQERIDVQQNLQSLREELEALKIESIASMSSLNEAKKRTAIAAEELAEKSKQLIKFKNHNAKIKKDLETEKTLTLSKENINQRADERLRTRELELKSVEKRVQTLRDRMFKDSQNLASLREKESTLIAEIKSSQSTSKNLNLRLQQLEKERVRQQEIAYNADFKLQQMERQVARGLGERSDEEKTQLQKRIAELEDIQSSHEKKNRYLTQQCRNLQQELHKWQRKHDHHQKQEKHIQETISEVELEISSCETNLQKLVTKEEEEMVNHDLVRLEVRRLRDTLNSKAGEVQELEELRDNLVREMCERKAEICFQTDVRRAQLRAAEEERHKSVIELGKRKIAAEKMQLKFETLTKAHHTDDIENEKHSQVYYLIAAAQKRADLQREGDRLDAEIQKKEKETRVLENTLTHLKQRNTNLRQSFTKIDCNSKDYTEILDLEEKLTLSEKNYFNAKKGLLNAQRRCDGEMTKLEELKDQRSRVEKDNDALEARKLQLHDVITKLSSDIDVLRESIKKEQITHKTRDYPHIKFQDGELTVQEQFFQAEFHEKNLDHIAKILMEIGREFPETKKSVITVLMECGLSTE